MKQLIIISQALLTLSFFSGCVANSTATPPSQNKTLNSITKSNAAKEKDGAMQRSLDNWLHNDWSPTVAKNKEVQEKYMEIEKVQESTKTTSIKENTNNIDKKTTSKKKTTVKYVEKEDRPFTLQEYVDKAAAYIEEKPNDYENSNVKKLESLPAIGK